MEFEWIFRQGSGFRRESLPPPSACKKDMAIVRPKWVGICGSDLYFMATSKEDLRLGHEWVGVVESVGPGSSEISAGDLVTSTATWGCAACEYCGTQKTNLCGRPTNLSSPKMGALRSWFEVPASQLIPVNGPADPSLALHEVLAVADEAVRLATASGPTTMDGEWMILGAGTVGVLAALVAREQGFRVTPVDPNLDRVNRAKSLGLSALSLPEALLDRAHHRRYSVLIDATSNYSGGTGGFPLYTTFCKPEFQAVVVGKYVESPLIPQSLFRTAANLTWMRGVPLDGLKSSVKKWNGRTSEIAASVISHIYPQEEMTAAFERAKSQDGCLKVVVALA